MTATKVRVRKSSTATFPRASSDSAFKRTELGQVQLGQTGLKRSYGYVYEELLPQLQGRKAIDVFQEMSQNSPVIGGMLFAIDMFMRKVAWRVESASESDKDKKNAKFLESCKDDMEHTWADFVSEVNSMLVFGWAWFEIVYKQRRNDVIDEFGTTTSKFNDGKVGWKKFMPCSQESWWRWDFDPATGKTIGMWQRPAPDYSERYLPIGKSLHFRTTSRKDNPEGASILRTAYRPWYFLKRIEEIEAVGVERDLAGIPFASVPAEMLSDDASANDKAMIASIIKLVQNVRRDEQEGIVWPSAYDAANNPLYEFKLLTSGGTRQFPTDSIITRYEQRIAMTALADFLLLGNDASAGGSYALATSKSSMFQSALETWLNIIENVINERAVPLLFRQNGINSGPYPQFRHDIVQKPTLTDIATLISALAGAGAQLFPDVDLENHIREFAELPIRETDDKTRSKEVDVIEQQLDTLLAESEAQEALAQRSEKDASAEGISGMPVGSIPARVDPVTFKPPAGGATGTGAVPGASPAGKATGPGGKKPGSAKGAPTKSTGPVKSTQPPRQRRATISTRAAQGAGAKSTGGMKNRSVAKHYALQDSDQIRKRVKKQMSANFPKESMKWMKDAVWQGPIEVPVDMLDFSNQKSWRASKEPDKVKEFTKQVKAGYLKPIVAVQTPDNNRLEIVDGHHHALAYKKAGQHALAFVGTVRDTDGPWDEMHTHQIEDATPELKNYDPSEKKVKKYRARLYKTEGVVMRPADTKFVGNKRCDHCWNTATEEFVQKSTGGVLARCCQTHIPQARAEIRWSQNNELNPNNPTPYDPFPRVLTQ